MTLGSPVHSPVSAPSFAGHATHAHSSTTPHHSVSFAASAASPMTATTFPASGGAYLNQHQTVGATGHGFLPSYLMGDVSFSQQSTPPTGRLLSPTKLNRSISVQQSSTPITPRPNALQQQPTFLTPNTREKPSGGGGGPPTTGLSSSVLKKGTPTSSSRFATPSNLHSTPLPSTPQLSFGATPVRDEVIGGHALGSCQDVSNNWVTVFGFPPSAASFILSQFSQLGTILQHHIPPNGNWMHLKYQTKMQAQKALGKSNKVMGGSIMIGVSLCSDPVVTTDDNYANNSSILNQSHVIAGSSSMVPLKNQMNHSVVATGGGVLNDHSVTTLNSSLGGSYLNRSSIRPLTQAYKAANADADILNRTNTANKSSGFVSKAMEYIFGW